ncbi:MAG: branched-chain amino acid ABC transporter substrate-binding protein [Anaerolineae bacterium]|nr:branched-chain amino acid ABC transporter substrate-binding protein [Anaerolineae bacterium]
MNIRKVMVIVLVLALSVAGVSAQDNGAPEGPIKLGFLGPVTGPAAWVGEEQVQWMRLAVEDFNAATGWNVELVEGDTQLDPAEGILAAESVIADSEILGVVGPAGSQVTEATLELFSQANLAHVSAASTKPDLTQQGFDTFFRVVPHDDVQGPSAAAFLYETLGITKLFVIDDQSSYATNIVASAEEAFTALGGEIVGRASISQEDQDFSALVTRLGVSDAEAIFFASQVASQGALLANQMLEQGVDLKLFGTDGMFSPVDFIDEADGATEGAYVSVFAPDVRGVDIAADVVERYQAAYDDDFGSFGPPAYVATMVVLEAMARANDNGDLTREGVLAEVANTDMEMTILGSPLAFDDNGDVLDASFYIFHVEDGRFVLNVTGDEAQS